MTDIYSKFQELAEKNKSLYTLLRFAVQSSSAIAIETVDTMESGVTLLLAKCPNIKVFYLGGETQNYTEFMNSSTVLDTGPLGETITEADLLYINTPAEGKYRASELVNYSKFIKKYIILPNTVENAHVPNSSVKMADNSSPVGLVLGINYFIQNNPNWYILEHDDIHKGITVLVNKDNA